MKKTDETMEMVSLNEGFFSLEPGNLAVEELERRLELAVAAIPNWVCGTFLCTTYGNCGSFACGTFNPPKPENS